MHATGRRWRGKGRSTRTTSTIYAPKRCRGRVVGFSTWRCYRNSSTIYAPKLLHPNSRFSAAASPVSPTSSVVPIHRRRLRPAGTLSVTADDLAPSPSAFDDLSFPRSPSADPAVSGELARSEEVPAILDTVPAIEVPLDWLAHIVAVILDRAPALLPTFCLC